MLTFNMSFPDLISKDSTFSSFIWDLRSAFIQGVSHMSNMTNLTDSTGALLIGMVSIGSIRAGSVVADVTFQVPPDKSNTTSTALQQAQALAAAITNQPAAFLCAAPELAASILSAELTGGLGFPSQGLTGGTIAGIVVICATLVLLLVFGVAKFVSKRRGAFVVPPSLIPTPPEYADEHSLGPGFQWVRSQSYLSHQLHSLQRSQLN